MYILYEKPLVRFMNEKDLISLIYPLLINLRLLRIQNTIQTLYKLCLCVVS